MPTCAPVTASAKTATIGYARFASWFQRPTSVTARAIGLVPKPQTRRIPYWPAIPTAAPPGATIESAVEACVIISAGQKRSPGRATIHGGAKVADVERGRRQQRDDPRPRDLLDDGPDVAVVGDLRQEERERRDDDRDADAADRGAAGP